MPKPSKHSKKVAHSIVKCNEQIFGVEENLARGLVAEYLSGARVEFVLDPLDIGIGQNREVGTFWEVLPERFRPLYFVRCRCPKGRGQTQLSPQKDTRLPNPSRDFLQRQKSARCTSLLNGRKEISWGLCPIDCWPRADYC